MKKEYNSPQFLFVGLLSRDDVTLSVNPLAADVGENPDGNAVFAD